MPDWVKKVTEEALWCFRACVPRRQHLAAAVTVLFLTHLVQTLKKEDFQSASARLMGDRTPKYVQREGEYFEGINGNTSLTAIIFKKI